jgi:hypothetical protein
MINRDLSAITAELTCLCAALSYTCSACVVRAERRGLGLCLFCAAGDEYRRGLCPACYKWSLGHSAAVDHLLPESKRLVVLKPDYARAAVYRHEDGTLRLRIPGLCAALDGYMVGLQVEHYRLVGNRAMRDVWAGLLARMVEPADRLQAA